MKKLKYKYYVEASLTMPLKAEDSGDATVKAWMILKELKKVVKKLDYKIIKVSQ